MSRRDALINRIAAIVGPAQVLTGAGDVASYSADGRGEAGGAPLAVARPADSSEVSMLVRLAAETDLRIVVQGGRTGLVGAGMVSEAGGDLIVNLDRLASHIVVDAENRTATVDAGVRLSALNEAAAKHGLFFPIDLGADPSIGGMIAANTGGARLLRYGDMRANLMAVDYVEANAMGTLQTLGAPLWKNNIGLDLKHLLVGSGGSIGIITRATVALQRKPALQLTALIALRNPPAALMLLLALEDSFGTLLTAFEGISAPAMTAAIKHVRRLRAPFAEVPEYAVLVELSAPAAFDADGLEERLAVVIERFMRDAAAPVLDVVLDHRERLWEIRHAVPEGLRAEGTVVACDIALRRGDVMRFRDDMQIRLAEATPNLIPHDFGHIGDGGLHYNLVWPKAAGTPTRAMIDRARAIIFDAVVGEYGGSFSAEHGIGPRNIRQYARFVPAEQRRLAGSIQQLMAPMPLGRVDFGVE